MRIDSESICVLVVVEPPTRFFARLAGELAVLHWGICPWLVRQVHLNFDPLLNLEPHLVQLAGGNGTAARPGTLSTVRLNEVRVPRQLLRQNRPEDFYLLALEVAESDSASVGLLQ